MSFYLAMKKTRRQLETYQAVYQRNKYAPVKKKLCEEKKESFLARYPDWEKKKSRLTNEEIYIISSYYGLNGHREFNRKIAKELNISTQWLYEKRKKIEAKLDQD
jgi:transcriptional regulator with PAS, ATPase and Fis domain